MTIVGCSRRDAQRHLTEHCWLENALDRVHQPYLLTGEDEALPEDDERQHLAQISDLFLEELEGREPDAHVGVWNRLDHSCAHSAVPALPGPRDAQGMIDDLAVSDWTAAI